MFRYNVSVPSDLDALRTALQEWFEVDEDRAEDLISLLDHIVEMLEREAQGARDG